MMRLVRTLTNPLFAAAGWLIHQWSLRGCRFGRHVGSLRDLSDGHHVRYCPRCATTVWVE